VYGPASQGGAVAITAGGVSRVWDSRRPRFDTALQPDHGGPQGHGNERCRPAFVGRSRVGAERERAFEGLTAFERRVTGGADDLAVARDTQDSKGGPPFLTTRLREGA